ncbi:response regulator transcription factor [Breoghania sp.]|uniref:response regulator transcription factor n=1 Tax=Breoghania sp. TaxID=2065378 RepID=UPI00261B7334|nr:response regulator transcription factor [Breoghania sp.]MDJ0930636.1 response regulator transcription factor [Breoghania sp.]
MFIIVDNREIVTSGYASGFEREGGSSLGLPPDEFSDWVTTMPQDELTAVDAFLIGDCKERHSYPRIIRSRVRQVPVLALNEKTCLEQTLELFAAGVDDVLRKPIHVREIMARVSTIRRRAVEGTNDMQVGSIRVFFDGRDPLVAGEEYALPRRERRILEFMARNHGRRVTKTQIYNAVYGISNEDVDESVVESHISKLRKKLKMQLGYDPIESIRLLGYMLKKDAE